MFLEKYIHWGNRLNFILKQYSSSLGNKLYWRIKMILIIELMLIFKFRKILNMLKVKQH